MALTREDCEIILIRRCGALMTAAGMQGTVCDGTNPDLNDPLGFAIRQSSGTVTSAVAVVDADMSALTDHDKLLDLAELRLLENILGNLDDVDIRLGQRSENLSQLATRLEARLTRLQAKVERTYGIGLTSLTGGYITLDFADHNEDLADEA